jgi:hypothetical protein
VLNETALPTLHQLETQMVSDTRTRLYITLESVLLGPTQTPSPLLLFGSSYTTS